MIVELNSEGASKALFLSDPLGDYFTGNIRETKIATLKAIGQVLVLYTEKV